jgi:hypothetical protein
MALSKSAIRKLINSHPKFLAISDQDIDIHVDFSIGDTVGEVVITAIVHQRKRKLPRNPKIYRPNSHIL